MKWILFPAVIHQGITFPGGIGFEDSSYTLGRRILFPVDDSNCHYAFEIVEAMNGLGSVKDPVFTIQATRSMIDAVILYMETQEKPPTLLKHVRQIKELLEGK